MSGIKQYLSFCDIMSSTFIHAVACIRFPSFLNLKQLHLKKKRNKQKNPPVPNSGYDYNLLE